MEDSDTTLSSTNQFIFLVLYAWNQYVIVFQ
jgi:hypothetical protein